MQVKKNDTVEVITGKDKKKRGRVLEVHLQNSKVLVEGVNTVKRHMKAGRNAKSPQGGIIELSAPIHMSNVVLVCGKCGKPTKVGHRVLEDGKKVRTCKKCGESMDK